MVLVFGVLYNCDLQLLICYIAVPFNRLATHGHAQAANTQLVAYFTCMHYK